MKIVNAEGCKRRSMRRIQTFFFRDKAYLNTFHAVTLPAKLNYCIYKFPENAQTPKKMYLEGVLEKRARPS